MHSLVVTELRLRQLDRNVHGVYQRLGMLLDTLAAKSTKMEILCLNPGPDQPDCAEDTEAAAELLRYWGIQARVINGSRRHVRAWRPWLLQQLRWTLGYRNSHFFSGLDNVGNRRMYAAAIATSPDLVLAHKLPVMEFVRTLTPANLPVLFDLDDVEDVAFERQLQCFENRRDRLVARAMLPGIRRALGQAVRHAKHTFVCSWYDESNLSSRFSLPAGRILVVPNSCVMRSRQPIVKESVLLFVGTFSWPPNAQAADYFLRECWDLIRQDVPDARLLLVGRNPELIASFQKAPTGVEFLGFVDDIEAAYQRARVVICPVLSGGGTRVKLVEAAAFGKPIISTTVGSEGLDFVDGRHALLRNDPAAFSAACIELLDSDRRCAELAQTVYQYARECFDRNEACARVRSVIERLPGVRATT